MIQYTQRAISLERQFGISHNAAMAVARAEHHQPTRSEVSMNGDGYEIRIYTAIGDDWFGFTAGQLSDALSEADGADITLRINSPGGNVWDAVAMYNVLQDYSGTVTAIIDGEASSAASFFPMAADRLEMSAAGMLMIHNAWVMAVGNADEMREVANTLEKVDGTIADIYASRSGTDADRFRELMAAETFLTADEAFELGLVDYVRPLTSSKSPDRAAAKRTAQARSEVAKMAVALMNFS